MKRVARVVIVSLGLVVVAAACGGDDDAAPTEPGVVIVDDNVFRPKTITVAPGDTVTWQFEGNSAHNVTHDDFASELMKDGEFEHTFEMAGEYDYVCTVHAGMAGSVTVE